MYLHFWGILFPGFNFSPVSPLGNSINIFLYPSWETHFTEKEDYALLSKARSSQGVESDQSILYVCTNLPKWNQLLCITIFKKWKKKKKWEKDNNWRTWSVYLMMFSIILGCSKKALTRFALLWLKHFLHIFHYLYIMITQSIIYRTSTWNKDGTRECIHVTQRFWT